MSDPLSRKAYVTSCLLLPGPLTLTGTTLKPTLGLLLVLGSTGMESLDTANVFDAVTGEGGVGLSEGCGCSTNRTLVLSNGSVIDAILIVFLQVQRSSTLWRVMK